MANRKSQIAGTRKIHHGGTEIAEMIPQFVDEQGYDPILSALRAPVVRDSQETHGERMAEYAKQSQLPGTKFAKQSQFAAGRVGDNCNSEKRLR